MKVAIIGAGICGLYLAKNLAEKGNEVAVFEQRQTVGKLCCSGLFSDRLFRFIPEAKALVQNQINRCVINFPKKQVNLSFKHKFFIIDHATLDLLAAALATRAGTDIRLSQKINETSIKELESKFDCVIGCDGALSLVRNYLLSCVGPTHANQPKVSIGLTYGHFLGIQGIENKMDNSDTVETWATPSGFIWRIPRGENIEWGIMEKPDRARHLFDEFISAGVRPPEMRQEKINLVNIKSAIIPQDFFIPNNEKITLCGDASGLTKPWSGGGVIWNLHQARILLKNFPNFLQYRKEASRFFSFEIFGAKFVKKMIYFLGFKFPALLPNKAVIDGDFLTKTND